MHHGDARRAGAGADAAAQPRLRADTGIDRHVIAVCARLRFTPAGTVLDVASGGHPPLPIRRAGGGVEVVEVRGVILVALQQAYVGQRRVKLHPGDVLVFYTDGILEARGADGMFGEERLHEIVAASGTMNAEQLGEHIHAQVAAYRKGPVDDDIAILAVQITGHTD